MLKVLYMSPFPFIDLFKPTPALHPWALLQPWAPPTPKRALGVQGSPSESQWWEKSQASSWGRGGLPMRTSMACGPREAWYPGQLRCRIFRSTFICVHGAFPFDPWADQTELTHQWLPSLPFRGDHQTQPTSLPASFPSSLLSIQGHLLYKVQPSAHHYSSPKYCLSGCVFNFFNSNEWGEFSVTHWNILSRPQDRGGMTHTLSFPDSWCRKHLVIKEPGHR